MGERTRATARSRTPVRRRRTFGVVGVAGITMASGALLVLGPAAGPSFAASSDLPAGTAATSTGSTATDNSAPLAFALDGPPLSLPAPAPAKPLFDPAALARIATYVSSVIPAPAPPPAPVVTTPPAAPVAKAPTVAKAKAPVVAKPKAPAAPVASAGSAYEARLLALVNQARAANGIAPVVANGCANGYARSWAAHQASVDSMSHQSLSPILAACGGNGVAENVAYGNISADQMFTNWMNSAGHRANILNPKYTAMGNGAATTASGRVYGSQVFLAL